MKHRPAATRPQKAPRINEDQPRRKNGADPRPPSTEKQNASPVDLAGPQGNGNILPGGQNIALPAGNSALSSVASIGNSVSGGRKMAQLVYRKTDKSGSSSYSIPGLKSSVYFNKGMFPGEPPATIDVPDIFTQPGSAQAKTGVAKLTPEERKANLEAARARRAAMTPAERAAERVASAQKALEAAQKAAEKAAATPATPASM